MDSSKGGHSRTSQTLTSHVRALAFCVVAGFGLACAAETPVQDCGNLTSFFFDDFGGHIMIDDRNYPVSAAPKNMTRQEDYSRLVTGRRTCIEGRANEHGRLTVYSVTQSE